MFLLSIFTLVQTSICCFHFSETSCNVELQLPVNSICVLQLSRCVRAKIDSALAVFVVLVYFQYCPQFANSLGSMSTLLQHIDKAVITALSTGTSVKHFCSGGLRKLVLLLRLGFAVVHIHKVLAPCARAAAVYIQCIFHNTLTKKMSALMCSCYP